MRNVHVGPYIPCLAELVAQFDVAAVLVEGHVPAVAVGAVVGERRHAGEAAGLHAVRRFGLERVVGAVACADRGSYAVFAHLARYDVDDAAHGVRTVEHRGGAAHHFDAVGQHRLIGVGDRVPHQPHVLRMTVDQDQQSRGRIAGFVAVADAAQGHLPGGSGRDAVAHQSASRDEEPRHLFGKRRQQRGLSPAFDLRAPDHGNRHRQMAQVGFAARARNHHLADGVHLVPVQRVAGLRMEGAQRCHAADQKQQYRFRFHRVGRLSFIGFLGAGKRCACRPCTVSGGGRRPTRRSPERAEVGCDGSPVRFAA